MPQIALGNLPKFASAAVKRISLLPLTPKTQKIENQFPQLFIPTKLTIKNLNPRFKLKLMQCQMYRPSRNARYPIRYPPRGRIVQPTRLMQSNQPLKQSTAGVAHTLAQAQSDLTEEQSKDNFDRVANMAREAYDIGKEIMGMINVEYKRYQGAVLTFQPTSGNIICSQTATQTNGHFNFFTEILQGDDDAQRVGDSIKVQNLVMKMECRANAGGAQPYYIKVIFYWDESNQIDRTFANVSGAGSTTGLLENLTENISLCTMATKDYDGDIKTKILHEKLIKVGATLATESDSVSQHEFNLKINRHTQYENNTNTVNSGALKCLVMSSAVSGDLNRPSVSLYYQVYYTDD